MKKERQRKESPFSFLLASFCTSLPLRSSSPALILSTPFLMVTVRGAHLFCSVVFCCCHSGDASFLCICTSKAGVGGRVLDGEGRWRGKDACNICWSWHTFGNQKPKDRGNASLRWSGRIGMGVEGIWVLAGVSQGQGTQLWHCARWHRGVS